MLHRTLACAGVTAALLASIAPAAHADPRVRVYLGAPAPRVIVRPGVPAGSVTPQEFRAQVQPRVAREMERIRVRVHSGTLPPAALELAERDRANIRARFITASQDGLIEPWEQRQIRELVRDLSMRGQGYGGGPMYHLR
jgi:hypothetical protein